MLNLSNRTVPNYGEDLGSAEEYVEDLRRAEEYVGEARRIVQTQKGLILRLKTAGVDTLDAECTLRLFESNLRRFEEHRDILKGNMAY